MYCSFWLNQNWCAVAFTVTASFQVHTSPINASQYVRSQDLIFMWSIFPISLRLACLPRCLGAKAGQIDLLSESVVKPCSPECLSRAAEPELLLMLNICTKYLRRSQRIFPTPLVVSGCSSSNYHVTWPVSAHDSNTAMHMVIQCYPLHILVIVITDLICVH